MSKVDDINQKYIIENILDNAVISNSNSITISTL
jgi:hypothetical protein